MSDQNSSSDQIKQTTSQLIESQPMPLEKQKEVISELGNRLSSLSGWGGLFEGIRLALESGDIILTENEIRDLASLGVDEFSLINNVFLEKVFPQVYREDQEKRIFVGSTELHFHSTYNGILDDLRETHLDAFNALKKIVQYGVNKNFTEIMEKMEGDKGVKEGENKLTADRYAGMERKLFVAFRNQLISKEDYNALLAKLVALYDGKGLIVNIRGIDKQLPNVPYTDASVREVMNTLGIAGFTDPVRNVIYSAFNLNLIPENKEIASDKPIKSDHILSWKAQIDIFTFLHNMVKNGKTDDTIAELDKILDYYESVHVLGNMEAPYKYTAQQYHELRQTIINLVNKYGASRIIQLGDLNLAAAA